jgi:hypothetical protein
LSSEQHVRELARATERGKLVQLIAARAPETLDRYAELRSRCRTPSASELIARICADIEHHEQSVGRRVRKRRERSGAKFSEALERFVGDLLRARAGTNTTGRIFRSVGKSSFGDAPVKYDMFVRLLEALKALGLVEHRKGRTHATGRGRHKERGRIIRDYERKPETERLERDIKELNEFLARFELTGGRHEGYVRIFNNCSWQKGGRLYSQCHGSYQLMPEPKRWEMKINGEPVAEIDIKASFLTVYHAKLGMPLGDREDPGLVTG